MLRLFGIYKVVLGEQNVNQADRKKKSLCCEIIQVGNYVMCLEKKIQSLTFLQTKLEWIFEHGIVKMLFRGFFQRLLA